MSMGMRMEMRVSHRQRQIMEIDEEILWRRARVIVFRMQWLGEMVILHGSDEVNRYVLELLRREHPLRVEPGMVLGYF